MITMKINSAFGIAATRIYSEFVYFMLILHLCVDKRYQSISKYCKTLKHYILNYKHTNFPNLNKHLNVSACLSLPTTCLRDSFNRGSTGSFLLLQYTSGVFSQPRDLQEPQYVVSVASHLCFNKGFICYLFVASNDSLIS